MNVYSRMAFDIAVIIIGSYYIYTRIIKPKRDAKKAYIDAVNKYNNILSK